MTQIISSIDVNQHCPNHQESPAHWILPLDVLMVPEVEPSLPHYSCHDSETVICYEIERLDSQVLSNPQGQLPHSDDANMLSPIDHGITYQSSNVHLYQQQNISDRSLRTTATSTQLISLSLEMIPLHSDLIPLSPMLHNPCEIDPYHHSFTASTSPPYHLKSRSTLSTLVDHHPHHLHFVLHIHLPLQQEHPQDWAFQYPPPHHHCPLHYWMI